MNLVDEIKYLFSYFEYKDIRLAEQRKIDLLNKVGFESRTEKGLYYAMKKRKELSYKIYKNEFGEENPLIDTKYDIDLFNKKMQAAYIAVRESRGLPLDATDADIEQYERLHDKWEVRSMIENGEISKDEGKLYLWRIKLEKYYFIFMPPEELGDFEMYASWRDIINKYYKKLQKKDPLKIPDNATEEDLLEYEKVMKLINNVMNGYYTRLNYLESENTIDEGALKTR